MRLRTALSYVASGHAAHVIECLLEVLDDVVPIFQPDREPDAARIDAPSQLFVFGQGGMSHRVGIFNQGLDLPQTDSQRDGIRVLSNVINKRVSATVPDVLLFEREVE